MPLSYAKAGVDVKKVKGIQKDIATTLAPTLSKDVLLGAGHYAGVVKAGNSRLALHTDGVGTKVLVAEALGKYDTVGIDAIAMNVNDIVCLGARPIAAVDYLAMRKADDALIAEILKGLIEGCRQSKCSLIGGETAIVPDLVKGGEKGFDLSATALGVIEGEMITGRALLPGDAVVGLYSSGLHSNGYTLARKILMPQGRAEKRVLEMMLVPTLIYTESVLEMLASLQVHGLAHITGGAFCKLMRIGQYAGAGFVLDSMPKPPEVFELIAQEGGIGAKEMHSTFNMGVGFCVALPQGDAAAAVKIAKRHGFGASAIGRVVKGVSVTVESRGEKMRLA
ncbi:MAG: phosphoribosylformylglycinamidine cyclo-ligase [Candidatus Micrarchaeota archaeon]